MCRVMLFIVFLLFFYFIYWAVAPLVFLINLILLLTTNNKSALRTFIGYDQLINAEFPNTLNWIFKDPEYQFGNPDETISGVIGKNLRDYPTQSHKSLYIMNKLLTKLDKNSKNHCIDSIEDDE